LFTFPEDADNVPLKKLSIGRRHWGFSAVDHETGELKTTPRSAIDSFTIIPLTCPWTSQSLHEIQYISLLLPSKYFQGLHNLRPQILTV
jgi:hypothetical protein